MAEERNFRKVRRGYVVSDKMDIFVPRIAAG